MNHKSTNIVIVGHVDHGKSTLIGRLLHDTGALKDDFVNQLTDSDGSINFAHVMDQLIEEQDESITIDTSQIFFTWEERKFTIIDAPGHVEFIRNMITGASQADMALLVVDVNEGVLEQTKRHAYLLSLLGIDRVIAVINKMGTSGYKPESFQAVADETNDCLAKNGIVPMATIPVDALAGENVVGKSEEMPWYEGEPLLQIMLKVPGVQSNDGSPFRMPVQDIYEYQGNDVAVGQIESGKITVGDSVLAVPKGIEVSLKEIIDWPDSPETAVAGESIGFVVDSPIDLQRGDILASKTEIPVVNTNLSGMVFWMGDNPLSLDDKITVCCTTQRIDGIVTRIQNRYDTGKLEVLETDSCKLGNNETALVSFQLDQPIVTDDFKSIPPLGRFVIEKGGVVVGAGTVQV